MKLKVKLNSNQDVRRFVDITSQYSDNLELCFDRYTVDAKSILGIFSLDLRHPVDLVCSNPNEQLVEDLKEFIA